jgi:tripartite-type tricarboxylate transporter receptor subunit TctC
MPVATAPPTALAPYPTRPLRMKVASSAGTATDCFARVMGDQLGSLYHQQVIIDDRPGAGGLMWLMHKKARRVSAAAGARRTRAYTR